MVSPLEVVDSGGDSLIDDVIVRGGGATGEEGDPEEAPDE
jgi:hypothetical protein